MRGRGLYVGEMDFKREEAEAVMFRLTRIHYYSTCVIDLSIWIELCLSN